MGKTVGGKPWSSMSKVHALAKVPGEHTDPGMPGFGLRVSPQGKIVWFIRGSTGSGKNRKSFNRTVGDLVPVGQEADGIRWYDLEQARIKAQAISAEEKLPEAAKQKLKLQKTNTLRTVLPEFLKHRRIRGRGTPLSAATRKDYQQVFDVYLTDCAEWNLVEAQGAVRLWIEVIRDIGEKSVSKAYAALNLISGVYDYLELLEEVSRNPMRKVRRLYVEERPVKRSTHVSALNLPVFIQQALTIRNSASRTAVLLDVLTGLRKSALLGLRWEYLDLDNNIIQVPKMTPGWKGWYGEFPLSSAACELLKDWKDKALDRNDWVFPARHGNKEHMTDVRGALNHACKSIELEIPQPDGSVKLRPYGQHDLRRTFGTVVRLLFPGDVQLAGALLAHKWAIPESPETDITLRYQSTRQELQSALDQVAAFVYEVAGIWPMSNGTKVALDRAGIDPRNLKLIALHEDDDEVDGDDEPKKGPAEVPWFLEDALTEEG